MLTDLSTPSLVMAKALVDNHVPQAVALAKRILEEHAPMEFNDYKINWVDAAKELPLMSEPFAPPLSIALWMDDSRKRQVSNVVLTICAGRVIPAYLERETATGLTTWHFVPSELGYLGNQDVKHWCYIPLTPEEMRSGEERKSA